MRRALLAAMLLAVPLLGGFECEVSVWAPGDTCTVGGWSDSTCDSDTLLLYCDAGTGIVEQMDCAAECAGGYCGNDVYGYNWCVCPDALGPGDACNYWTDYPSTSLCYGANSALVCGTDNIVYEWNCDTACPSGVVGYCGYDSGQGNDWCMCPDCGWTADCPCDYYTEYASSTCSGDLLTYCSETNVIGEISCTAQCESWYGAGASATCGNQPETGYNGCICELATCTFSPFCNDSLWLVWCDGSAETWTDCDAACRADSYSKGICDVVTNACVCG